MSRITLFALAGLAAFVAVAGLASAEWYEGKPECPPDRMCTMSYGDEPEHSDANDTSPECEECTTPPERNDGDASDDCWTTEEGGYVCKRQAGGEDDGPSMPVDCGGEVCAYDGAPSGCDAPVSSADAPDATADECPSLAGPGDDAGAPEPAAPAADAETLTDARRDAPAGALLGAVAALALVAAAGRRRA